MINNSIFCHEYLYAISVSILNTSLIISFETNIISAALFSNVVPLMLRHISEFFATLHLEDSSMLDIF